MANSELTAPMRGLIQRLKEPSKSMSAKLLVLTVSFVMLAEVLIYVPSIANYRVMWLEQRLAAAQIATLALEASKDQPVAADLERELLANAEVSTVALKRDDTRRLALSGDHPPAVDAHYDLRGASWYVLIWDAAVTLITPSERVIRVLGEPRHGGGEVIEIVLTDGTLRAAMIDYSQRILGLSIIISLITASLVFWALHRLLVRPLHRLTQNMTEFRGNPEDASRVIVPSSRSDEVGTAERELATMQSEIRAALNQKTRLAALGTAISKVNHDLRNILSSAQLISDRLTTSKDPTVQGLAPRLIASIDRAIELCTNTLRYGRADEPPPERQDINLAEVVDEVETTIAFPVEINVAWVNDIDRGLMIDADHDQLFRVLLNLGRNAVQAIEKSARTGSVTLTARRESGVSTDDDHAQGTIIEMSDTGPGLPERAREHLFQPFRGSAQAGGSGLGLAIARELTVAHGGDITLLNTGPTGTTFCIFIPDSRTPRLAIRTPEPRGVVIPTGQD